MILLDDDKLITDAWQDLAKLLNIELTVFNDVDEFREQITNFAKDSSIYIDYDLHADIKGDELAKELYKQGFTNLYLATAYPKDMFPDMYWIKEIVDKSPPF